MLTLYIIDIYNIVSHCATSRKGADSIPDGVAGIFHWLPHMQPHHQINHNNVF